MTHCLILFYCLFDNSCDSTASLLKFLEIFAKKDLQRHKEESVVRAKREVSGAYRRLDGTVDPPSSASIDIIKGLQQTSVERFKKF